jgi:hypothetical protein
MGKREKKRVQTCKKSLLTVQFKNQIEIEHSIVYLYSTVCSSTEKLNKDESSSYVSVFLFYVVSPKFTIYFAFSHALSFGVKELVRFVTLISSGSRTNKMQFVRYIL